MALVLIDDFPIDCNAVGMMTILKSGARTLLPIFFVGLAGCGTVTPSSEPPTADVREFPVRLGGMMIDGKLFTDSAGSRMCTLRIDCVRRTIAWDGELLLPLRRKDDMRYTFIHPKFGTEIGICLEPSHGELPVIADHWGPGSFRTCRIGGIPSGAAKAFIQQFESVKFPAAYQGLVAKTKWIDGTCVRLDNRKFAGYVAATEQGCVLSGKRADLYRVEITPGKKALMISSDTEAVVIWPDGAWLLFETADLGVSFSGYEEVFESFYLALREKAPERSLTESDKRRLPKVPQNLKEYNV